MSFLYSEFDRNLSEIAPLAGRKNDLTLSAISDMREVSAVRPELGSVASKIIEVRNHGAAVVLMMGAHVLCARVLLT